MQPVAVTIRQIIESFESLAPPALQEAYDNSGLLCGDPSWPLTGVLVTLDCTEAVLDEAVKKGCNLVVAHHPIVFKGFKKLTGKNYVERTLIKAIKNDVAIYALHTNLDNIMEGVSRRMAAQLGLINCRILQPKRGLLRKLTVFVPPAHTDALLQVLHQAGAGNVGNYSGCSFITEGEGRFTGNGQARPAIGTPLVPERLPENRLELLLPAYAEAAVLSAMRAAHPYEEVAYYLQTIENEWAQTGSGIVGNLPESTDELTFLQTIKTAFKAGCVRYTALLGKPVTTVALCGGSGSFLLPDALRAGADLFLTADFKYHEFFDADNRILIADIGHFESEQYTKDLLFKHLSENFSNIAVRFSETETNPVKYL